MAYSGLYEQYRDVIVRGLEVDIDPDVINNIALFRYRERFRLSYQDLMAEPPELFSMAFLIWELDKEAETVRLKAKEENGQ